jgi:hypothetical protein
MSSFRRALELAPFPGPAVLQHLQGPSYMYAIVMDPRIRASWDRNHVPPDPPLGVNRHED